MVVENLRLEFGQEIDGLLGDSNQLESEGLLGVIDLLSLLAAPLYELEHLR